MEDEDDENIYDDDDASFQFIIPASNVYQGTKFTD